MKYHRYLCELLGAFALTFAVWLSVAFAMPFPTPVVAALTLALFVYLVGPISGAHLNPAVTVGMLSIKRISPHDAALYVIAQLVGASLAMFLGVMLSGENVSVPTDGGIVVGIAEAIGTFFLAFAVASAVGGKLNPAVTGLAVGGSLFLGIYLAFPFSNAILNPAVALGINSFGAMYILGPVLGAVGGAWAYELLSAGKSGPKPPAVRTK